MEIWAKPEKRDCAEWELNIVLNSLVELGLRDQREPTEDRTMQARSSVLDAATSLELRYTGKPVSGWGLTFSSRSIEDLARLITEVETHAGRAAPKAEG